MEKDIGTILRLYPLGEYGLIVCWCTAAHGIVRTAARNARKPGSDFYGRIDLFHECELLYRLPKEGDLAALSSVALLNPRLPLRAELNRLRLASYISALLAATVETGDCEPAWHALVSPALDYIATATPRLAILERFERRLAELHGLYTPDIAPHRALAQHFSHLPGNRAALLEALNRE